MQIWEKQMKTSLFRILLIAGALLMAVNVSWALPPMQRSFSGEITAVNHDERILSLRSNDGRVLSFKWNRSTRFLSQGNRHCMCVLRVGSVAKVYYRREIGQLILRQANVRVANDARCTFKTEIFNNHFLCAD